MWCLLVTLTTSLFAQDDPKFVLKASLEPAEAAPGEAVTLVLRATTAAGWHAYGTLETGNIPVSLDTAALELTGLERAGEAKIPGGLPEVSPYGTTYPLPESFRVTVPLKVAAGATGALRVAGGLGYQICMQGSCEQPNTAAFEATGEVDAAAPASSAAEQEPPPPIPVPGLGTVPGLMLGGGLFALAMPCTYPMIPITFSFFTKQAEKAGGNVLPLTITYGLGIIAMFVFVGVALSAVIIDVVNHWATNAVIGAMFFFFAAVLFGWVNLNPPQFLQRLATKAQMSAAGAPSGGSGLTLGGLSGVFFMGATLVLTSFTCTAPIVGSLIGGIAKHGTTKVAVGMGIFGLTMAIPFMALSLAPTKVKAMPKSGEWMETLKISLGFVELAAAFKFVSMVDIYFGWDALPRELFLMLWAAVFGLWALYLFGVLRKAGTPSMGVGNGRMAGGMIVTLLATYFLFGAMGNRMDKIMTGFVPAYSNRIVMKGERGGPKVQGHVIVKDDPQKAIEVAKAEDKLVLYNFTGFN